MISELEFAKALKDVLPYVVVTFIDCDNRRCDHPCCISCFGLDEAQADASEALTAKSQASKTLEAWENNMPSARNCGDDCDASEYYCGVIPPACQEYTGDDGYCTVCWHDKKCHQAQPEQLK